MEILNKLKKPALLDTGNIIAERLSSVFLLNHLILDSLMQMM